MSLQQTGLATGHPGQLACLGRGSSPEEETHVQMGAHG